MTKFVLAAMLLLVGLAGCSDPRADQAKALQAELAAKLMQSAPKDGAPGILFETVIVSPDDERDTGFKGGITGLALDLGPQGRLPIGTVSFVLLADGEDVRSFSDIRLPTEIAAKLTDGTDLAIAMPAAGGTAVWSNAQDAWIAADFDLGRVELTSVSEKLAAAVDLLRYKLETQPGTEGRSDQNSSLAAEGLAVKTEEGEGTAATVSVRYSMTGAKLAELAKLNAEYQKAAVTQDVATLADVLRRMTQALRGFELRFEATDSRQTEPESTEAVKLAASGFTFGMSGLDEAEAQMRLGLDLGGVELPEAAMLSEDERAAIPSALKLNLDLAKIPTAKLIEIASSSTLGLGKDAGGPDTLQLAGMMMLFGLQNAFAEAGTELRISDSAIETIDARTAIAGMLAMDPQAMMGATGTIDLEVAGLDRLASRIERLVSPELAAWLKQAAVTGTAADGSSLASFRLELTADGSFTVNGQPLPM